MALSKLAKRRIMKLIEFMEGLPPKANKHFDMGMWCTHEDDSHSHLIRGDAFEQKDIMACGTSACAAGWAATLPYFKRLGLELRWGGYDAALHVNGKPVIPGSKALARVFDVGGAQTYALFSGANEDRTPKKWAKRARELIKEWGAA